MITFKNILKKFRTSIQEKWYSRYQPKFDRDLCFSRAVEQFPKRNDLHAYMHHYFHHLCSQIIKDHRTYFKADQRGFGEDAFHAMWWLLLREFQPRTSLEIGIYRGQIISLWALIAKQLNITCEIYGISPFTSLGDTVSQYRQDLDYLSDTLNCFRYWQLTPPTLIKALSTDPLAVTLIRNREWNLIYIDGCHDYDVARTDYCLCRDNLTPGGLLVLDDASLGTSFHPPLFSFAGHSGPSRVAKELAMKELHFIGAVGHNNVFLKPQ